MSFYDQALQRFRTICADLPEMAEVLAWGHPTFRAGKKMFAGIGQQDGDVTIGLRVGHERQEELLRDKRFFPTPYAAHMGWVSFHVDRKTDWDEVRQLAVEAYRTVALKRMLKALDAGGTP